MYMCVYIYIYTYMHVCVYIYIYTHVYTEIGRTMACYGIYTIYSKWRDAARRQSDMKAHTNILHYARYDSDTTILRFDSVRFHPVRSDTIDASEMSSISISEVDQDLPKTQHLEMQTQREMQTQCNLHIRTCVLAYLLTHAHMCMQHMQCM